MSYTKQTFVKGQILKAAHLNHMEEGLKAISDILSAPSPNCHLITDDNGNRVWAPLENNVILHKTVLTPTENEPGSYYIYGTWAKLPVEGNVCTVNYNGVNYECEIIGVPGDMDLPDGTLFVMGNLEDTLEGVVGNPAAPFAIIGLYVPQQGIAGLLYARDEATTVVLSITGDGVSAPVGSAKPINITIHPDGTASADMAFAEAWLLSATELQASILIREMSVYKGATTTTVDTVSKVEAALNGAIPNMIVLRIKQPWIDTSDMGDRDNIRYLGWHAGDVCVIEGEQLNALPIIRSDGYYLRHNGSSWMAVNKSQVQDEINNVFIALANGTMLANGTGGEITMQISRSQIEGAITNGKQVFLHLQATVLGGQETLICLPLVERTETELVFESNRVTLVWQSDGTITWARNTGVATTTDVFYTANGEIVSTMDGMQLHVQKGDE